MSINRTNTFPGAAGSTTGNVNDSEQQGNTLENQKQIITAQRELADFLLFENVIRSTIVKRETDIKQKRGDDNTELDESELAMLAALNTMISSRERISLSDSVDLVKEVKKLGSQYEFFKEELLDVWYYRYQESMHSLDLTYTMDLILRGSPLSAAQTDVAVQSDITYLVAEASKVAQKYRDRTAGFLGLFSVGNSDKSGYISRARERLQTAVAEGKHFSDVKDAMEHNVEGGMSLLNALNYRRIFKNSTTGDDILRELTNRSLEG